MSMARDYYEILGVGRDATSEEIKKAFRRIARETHPDANPNDPEAEERFRAAAEAYEVLSDPERRARYDRGDTIDISDIFSAFGGIDDVLRSVFGEGGFFTGRPSRASRGRDVLVHTEVPLEVAAFGGEANVEFNTRVTCGECRGSGAEPGSKPVTCSECGGAGQVRVSQRSLLGTMTSVSTCRRCGGEGSVIGTPCSLCHGSGSLPDTTHVSVEVPPGVATGTRLRISGHGESGGRTGPPGNLFVEIIVRDHPRFERRDADLVHTTSIGIAEAALGTSLEVPLIEGATMELEVPKGTQPGTVIRVPGRGMTVFGRRTRGDLLVLVNVEIPEDLSPEEAELLRRWAELRGERTDRPASAP